MFANKDTAFSCFKYLLANLSTIFVCLLFKVEKKCKIYLLLVVS